MSLSIKTTIVKYDSDDDEFFFGELDDDFDDLKTQENEQRVDPNTPLMVY